MSTDVLLAAAAIFFTGLTIILGHDVFERSRRRSRLRVRIAADLAILKDLRDSPTSSQRDALQRHVDWQIARLLKAEKSPAMTPAEVRLIREMEQAMPKPAETPRERLWLLAVPAGAVASATAAAVVVARLAGALPG
jgi:hypothetical protein